LDSGGTGPVHGAVGGARVTAVPALLLRLKRERRWAVAIFVIALATIIVVQRAAAPRASGPAEPPAAESSR
jgi:hypothetical protein